MDFNDHPVAPDLAAAVPRLRRFARVLMGGLDGADECTLEQIGQSFALTRERVRQIVTAALGKLHHQTQVKRLELEPTAD